MADRTYVSVASVLGRHGSHTVKVRLLDKAGVPLDVDILDSALTPLALALLSCAAAADGGVIQPMTLTRAQAARLDDGRPVLGLGLDHGITIPVVLPDGSIPALQRTLAGLLSQQKPPRTDH